MKGVLITLAFLAITIPSIGLIFQAQDINKLNLEINKLKEMKKFKIEIQIDTNKDYKEISNAIIKGLHYGLDVQRVAPPSKCFVTLINEITNEI